MHFAGILPEDAPDPRLAQDKQLRSMPVPVMGLVPQPSLEDTLPVSFSGGHDETGYSSMAVSINYTLWRNPDDRTDPVNLAHVDEAVKRALDEVPPWPRPAWLVERVEQMRYPMLWEAVRTSWYRDASELSSPRRLLVEHANHILVNRFRAELGLGDPSNDHRLRPRLTERAIDDRATARVNGADVPALEIDSDPFVYAIGTELGSGAILTAVIPRDELEHLRIEFVERTRLDR
ncbi:hypothetical protein [Agreia sp. COWG]|uniref:hypothetical protein n=1 Tax=Agreia sp. COWG TaxID=2773266 RepID=UPI001927C6D6|nr:hypothetical protein [Agreia sp. COWG]CAD5994991.1 conserved protein of unknown function [Agreia sp. COWG]